MPNISCGRRAAALAFALGVCLATPTIAEADYPVALANCGFAVNLAAQPQRIVTIKSVATDLLLALGLADRIVGQAFQDGPALAGHEQIATTIPVLSDRLPSREIVLDAAPDFIFAGWESNVSGEGVGPRALLASYDIGTYVFPAACRTVDLPPPLTFQMLFDGIEEAGRVFGASEAAAQLVAEQRDILASLVPSGKGLKAAWYSSGSDVPYMGGGRGMPHAIMSALGLTNIALGIDAAWGSMSWEAIADAEPDVFVLVDASWSSVARKIGIIESNPFLAKLEAVKNRRYLIVPFAASEAGVRSIPATLDLAQQLRALSHDE